MRPENMSPSALQSVPEGAHLGWASPSFTAHPPIGKL